MGKGYGVLLLVLVAASCHAADLPTREDLARWGRETLDAIRSDLYLPERQLYADELKDGKRSGPAFTWAVGVNHSALNAGARLDPAYRPALIEESEALVKYWNPLGPVAGYDVLPVPKPVDRYYDDNAWLVLGLAETAEITGDAKWRDQAELALKYVLSGEDPEHGGIFWRESDRKSRNTCATAPAAVSCYRLDRGTGKYQPTGDRLVTWLLAHLRDPADGLMWDNVRGDGSVDKAKFSYNTALTIRALADPSRGDASLDQAVTMSEAAVKRWQNPATGAMKDDACFAHLLCEALLEVDARLGRPQFRPAVLRALAFLHESGRDPNGHYGHRWEAKPTKPEEKVRLIDQASAARGYLLAALAMQP